MGLCKPLVLEKIITTTKKTKPRNKQLQTTTPPVDLKTVSWGFIFFSPPFLRFEEWSKPTISIYRNALETCICIRIELMTTCFAVSQSNSKNF